MPEPAQEVWKAEGRRKALRGNTKLWIWFNQDRKREKKIKNVAKKVAFIHTSSCKPASSTHPSQHHQTASCCLTTVFDRPKQNPTQHTAETNQTVKITLWFMSNHHLHTPLPKAGSSPCSTQAQEAFHGCSALPGKLSQTRKTGVPIITPACFWQGLFSGSLPPKYYNSARHQ